MVEVPRDVCLCEHFILFATGEGKEFFIEMVQHVMGGDMREPKDIIFQCFEVGFIISLFQFLFEGCIIPFENF